MVTDSQRTAPYAPIDNVLNVIRRLRDRGLPSLLTIQELERIGVPSGNAPRTLATLRFLGLVDDEGQRTANFERLGKATTEEYPSLLAEILRAAYEPVFTIVDPAEDGDIAITDAFRQYNPEAQRGRMVTLFMGLCREALIVPGGPPARRARVRSTVPSHGKGNITKGRTVTKDVADKDDSSAGLISPDYRVLAALIQQLPKDGKWTKQRRDKWLELVAGAVDYQIQTVGGDIEQTTDADNNKAPE